MDSPQCVPYTPHGDEASVFKYYCPLCMQYFKDVMKMKCCGNYICAQCCKDYIGTKGITLPATASISTIEERFINTNTTPCPHCQVSGFHPMSVSFEEMVRDYSSRYVPVSEQSSAPGYSPLRVGESFEDLKRKMIPYKNAIQLPNHPQSNDEEATPRDIDEEVVPYDHFTASPQREGVLGIAMVNYGSVTPLMLSPRLRLEPNSPDDTCQTQLVQAPIDDGRSAEQSSADSKRVDDSTYFHSDLSQVFESHRPAGVAEEKSLDTNAQRVETLPHIPLFEGENMAESSLNDVRVGSPSPRVAESKRELYIQSEEKSPLCGTSRSDSRSGSRSGSRNSGLIGPSMSSGRNAHVMNLYASGVVEQMFRAALAQHTRSAQQ